MPVDFLIVGLGNPGSRYRGTPHNVGFEISSIVANRFGLGRARARYLGSIREGVAFPGGPRVAVLEPHTYMNEAGRSVGPAAGALRVAPERVIVVHDEIDLSFGDVRVRRGGGLAGHRGLKSVKAALGTADFWRLRVGVGRPHSTDPEVVSRYVLGKFEQPRDDVDELVARGADAVEQLLRGDLSQLSE